MTTEPKRPVFPRPAGPSAGALTLSGLALAVALAACSGGPPDAPPSDGPDAPAAEAPSTGSPSAPGPDTAGGAAADPAAPDAPAGSDAPSPAPTPEAPSFWAYTCPDGLRFSVHLQEDEASVYLPSSEPRLPRVEAASGIRFAAGDTAFHARGGEARLEVGAETHEGCAGQKASSSRDAAHRLGFDFRGIGQEPGWIVDVDRDRQVRWVGQYGTQRFATGAPRLVEEGSGRLVWAASAPGHELRVEAVEEVCRDGMSGQRYTHTVRVRVDGEELDGCGGWLGSSGPA